MVIKVTSYSWKLHKLSLTIECRVYMERIQGMMKIVLRLLWWKSLSILYLNFTAILLKVVPLCSDTPQPTVSMSSTLRDSLWISLVVSKQHLFSLNFERFGKNSREWYPVSRACVVWKSCWYCTKSHLIAPQLMLNAVTFKVKSYYYSWLIKLKI